MAITPQDTAKRAAATAAATLVHSGMVVGLGTGTTAAFLLEALAVPIRDGRLRITGVPTSDRTAAEAARLGIPVTDLKADTRLDLAIDGADEVEAGTLNLIKGLGGALLREKIVACAAQRFVVIADRSKCVQRLGDLAPLPVEVVRFGHEVTARRLADLGGTPVLRRDAAGAPYVTDSGNLLYDCRGFAPIDDPIGLAERLATTVGVVESGLFIALAAEVYVGDVSGAVQILRDA